MARKTTGNGSTTRSKKTETPIQPAVVEVVPEVRKNAKLANVAPGNLVPVNLEEEIRLRAYELYLQRKGTPGDEMQDWLTAEREIHSRYGKVARQQTA